ncbi:hypothetical protein [Archangium lansingense]|uniref:Uncharacterized protein n=1 Tax=Archangium lansingense TaxID=2995310 RepID=A0ABT3ZW13_9BACT|nr:hypothetical protein [Archangium lansinium]MCY1073587.1 hypothetical protein [Archangium lansinium]
MAAKKPTTDAPAEDTASTHFCWNCGQEVAGKTKAAAETLVVAFCKACGRQLDEEGKCTRKKCSRFGLKASLL